MENLQYVYKLAANVAVIYSNVLGVSYLIIFLNWFWYRKEPKLTLESCRDVKNDVTAYITMYDRPHNTWFITKFIVVQFITFSFWMTIMSIVIAIVSIAMFFFK